jgi:hypothetical protein
MVSNRTAAAAHLAKYRAIVPRAQRGSEKYLLLFSVLALCLVATIET